MRCGNGWESVRTLSWLGGWSLCGPYPGWDMDVLWQGIYITEALSRGGRGRRVCGLSGSITRQTRGCLHVVFLRRKVPLNPQRHKTGVRARTSPDLRSSLSGPSRCLGSANGGDVRKGFFSLNGCRCFREVGRCQETFFYGNYL